MKLKNLKQKFGTVSGICTTDLETIILWAEEISGLGILTTKSITLESREGYVEPIIYQVERRSFRNAVGLSNPGLEEYLKKAKQLHPKFPKEKYLLTSIAGEKIEDYVELAKEISPYTDGIELNLSCPNVEKGMQFGKDKDLVYEVIKAVKQVTDKEVIAKLTPNIDNIGEIAKKAEEAGADAISAINTVGPEQTYELHTKEPTLTNKLGGESGRTIKQTGMECVEKIRKQVKIPIIAMGGIGSAESIREYQQKGADFFGIGSSLADLNTEQVKKYFTTLENDLETGNNQAIKLLSNKSTMRYKPYKIKKIVQYDNDLKVFYFDKKIKSEPGQYVFTWIPEHHEKPFSIANDKPLTLAVRKLGHHTSKLFDLKEKDELMIRGPYGKKTNLYKQRLILVGGGTGTAPMLYFAKKSKNPIIFIGAKNNKQIMFEKEFQKYGQLYIATEDGSSGYKGMVTDMLEEALHYDSPKDKKFINCGPKPMMEAASEIEYKHTIKSNIYNSLEEYTACGIGLCGKCQVKGLRSCIDGPIFNIKELD